MDSRKRDALVLLSMGVEPEKTTEATGGRPRNMVVLRGADKEVRMTQAEYTELVKASQGEVVAALKTQSMTEAELMEACRLAVPMLAKRAVDVALVSKDAREIMAVLNFLSDRGYGKVAKSADLDPEQAEYLRRGWGNVPQDGSMGIIEVEEDA